nr:glutamic acid-rich protein-like [Cherax quadricarinatus]
MLKERRESDDLYNIYSYADDDIEDPALKNEELNQKLTENESIAKDKLDKIFQEFVDKDAAVRESNDANLGKKKFSKKESQEKKLDKNDFEGDGEKKHNGEEQETAKEDIEGKEEQDVDDDADDDILVDVYDDDDEEDDDEDDDIEEIYDDHEKAEMQNAQQHNLMYDDDVSTDDDLKNVLASACFEEEIEYSEEDVPVIDSEDFGCFNTEEDNDSEVVCLDDDDNDVEAKNLGQPTLKISLPSSNSTHPVSNMNINNEKRKLEDVLSVPQKRPCLETSHP